jgi:anti-anti-sigma factor
MMTHEQTEIPLSGCDDAAVLYAPKSLSHGTSLESERFGLLARPRPTTNTDRRMEEWIASNLDLDDTTPLTPRSPWIRLIDGLPGFKRSARVQKREKKTAMYLMGWNRFHVAYRRGITVVRLTDRALVKEEEIREFACDLLDLIEAGNHRIVLNFQAVERLASWVVLVVDRARRRCVSADGGALKICGLPTQLASVFPIVGVALGNALHSDEVAAMDSPWPHQSARRTLPVEILAAIISNGSLPPIRGGAPAETVPVGETAVSRFDPPNSPSLDGIWLNVQIGGSTGRGVTVTGSKFLIGRERDCQLRLASPKVSKYHAAIERRVEGIVLADLGSANGTILNGRTLKNEEIKLNEGDRIQIGPLVATLHVGSPPAEVGAVDDLVTGWLNRDLTIVRSNSDVTRSTELAATAEADAFESEGSVKNEIIQDVLIVTPRMPELDDDESIESLRGQLHVLFEQGTPRHVVVNLECVRHLNAQAIGVLLAHHLRLDRVGGALRICQAHPRLMAMLHQVRLTILVEFHPTLDEAVLAAWPGSAGEVSSQN